MKLLVLILFTLCSFSQTTIDLGNGKISASGTGLSDVNTNVSGDPLGSVAFDLIITPVNGGVFIGPDGLAVSGGSNGVFLDNGNDLDLTTDEAITFTLSNVTNLPADTVLKITGVTLILGAGGLYEVDSEGVQTIGSNSEVITVSEKDSTTIYARGASSGTATLSTFAISNLMVELISSPPVVNPVEEECIVNSFIVQEDGEMTLKFQTEVGKEYIIQSSSLLTAGSWTLETMVVGTGGEVTFTDSVGDLILTPKSFYRVCVDDISAVKGPLVNNEVLEIEQTWTEEPSGYTRTALVEVPASGTGPFPVVLMLHGSGGNTSFINSMGSRFDSIIRVAPQGYGNQWNVDAEQNTDAPDVDFIKDLIALIKTRNNVDPNNISIMGSSNGAGMTNRLIIDLPAGTFHKAAGKVSQMISKMYDTSTGEFKTNTVSTSVAYNQVTTPATGIKIINVNGTSDTAVPYIGGSGVGTIFHDSQDSIYWLAQAMGETGVKLTDTQGIPGDGVNRPVDIVEYSYLGGEVVHYKVIGGNHGLGPYANESSDLIADFILN